MCVCVRARTQTLFVQFFITQHETQPSSLKAGIHLGLLVPKSCVPSCVSKVILLFLLPFLIFPGDACRAEPFRNSS